MNVLHVKESFLHKVLVLALVLLAATALATITYLAVNQLLIILFAVILSVPISSAIGFLARKLHWHRTLMYVVFWVFVALISALGVYFGANSIANELSTYNELSVTFSDGQDSLPNWVPEGVVTELKNINIISAVQNQFASNSLSNTASSIFGGITGLLILIVLVAYLTFNPRAYSSGLLSIAPSNSKQKIEQWLVKIPRILNRWMFSRLISMIVVGILTYIGLLLLGVEAALVLAIAAGLLSFIPNLGPILAAIPAILITLPQGLVMVGWIIGLYALVQFLESYFITPVVQKKAVLIHPAVLLSAQIVLGAVFGLMGLLLAGPLIAIAVGIHHNHSH